VYENLPHASILNTNLSIKYWFLRYFSWSGKVTYARGKDNENANLPLISPLSYGTSLSFKNANFFGQAEIEGASKQLNYSPEYGEDETKAYLIANIAFGYNFRINKTIFNLKTGVENLFDKYYSTYDDWKNIPRKGRNVFVGLILDI
jgi:iron complex outermembrane receptor protein